MPWFKVDDDFHDHPKVRRLGVGPVGLWTLCGSWSADNLTDGYVPVQVVRERGGKNWRRMADDLVAAGLWVPLADPQRANESKTRVQREKVSRRDIPAGYMFHDWAKYQPTREHTLAAREANAARQRAKRARSRAARHAVTSKTATDVPPRPGTPQREGVSQHPDPYGSTTRNGEVRDVVTSGSETPKTINAQDSKETPPGIRSAAVDATLAELRARLPKGRPLRGRTTPMDPPDRDGAS